MPPKPRTSLFLAYCPDRIGPTVVETRLKVRAQHFAEFKVDQQAGRAEFGRAILPPPTSALRTTPNLFPEGVQPMGGSVMLLRYPSLEAAWARVRDDVYWTAGVWDPERTVVEEFCEPPPTGSVKGVDAENVGGSGVGIE
ncbi:uncharacterized protein EHS24_001249 [Apiotrichum porosum]|uniref:YCII-related domain-containing protein n=1 Tax=Apiotrichum porosum TaxID=105984 RepID=A0A427XK16_9TREE|nr:uncharacterized protein EHS24_001249 [Apiotrichum porosum]RSH79210.1 hypothetical protein EHS24_001249 [Apiotrichum porosum]